MIVATALLISIVTISTSDQELLVLSRNILSDSSHLMSRKQHVIREANASSDPYWKAIRGDLPKYYDMAGYDLSLAYGKVNDATKARNQISQLGDLRLRALAHIEVAESLSKYGNTIESQDNIKAALNYIPSLPKDDRHEIYMLAASAYYSLKNYGAALKTSRLVWPELRNFEKLPVIGGPSRVPFEKWDARRIEALSLAGVGQWAEAGTLGENHPKLEFKAKTLLDLAEKCMLSLNAKSGHAFLAKGSSYSSKVLDSQESVRLLLRTAELLALGGNYVQADSKIDSSIRKLSAVPDDFYSGDKHLNRMRLLKSIYQTAWRIGATSQLQTCDSIVGKWYSNENTKFARKWAIELLAINLTYARQNSQPVAPEFVAKTLDLSVIADSIDVPWEALGRIVVELKRRDMNEAALSVLSSMRKYSLQGFGGGLDSSEVSMAAGCAGKIAEATFELPSLISKLRNQRSATNHSNRQDNSKQSLWPVGKSVLMSTTEGNVKYYLDVPRSFKNSSPLVCIFIPPGSGGQAFSAVDASKKGIAMAWIKSGPYQIGELAGRSVQIMDDLLARYGNNTKFIVCGLSAGGFAALQAGVTRRESTAGVIMAGCSQIVPKDLSFPVVFLVGRLDYNIGKARLNYKASKGSRVSIVEHSGGHTIGDQGSRSKAIDELFKLARS